MEAFVGVLYAGFCTAVLFGKVIRSQSRAQIYFSDPMVLRFGKEELCDDADSKGKDVEMGEGLGGIREERGEEHVPCPSLEFRLVNRLHDDVQGGEIGKSEIFTSVHVLIFLRVELYLLITFISCFLCHLIDKYYNNSGSQT